MNVAYEKGMAAYKYNFFSILVNTLLPTRTRNEKFQTT